MTAKMTMFSEFVEQIRTCFLDEVTFFYFVLNTGGSYKHHLEKLGGFDGGPYKHRFQNWQFDVSQIEKFDIF